jgi:hypothetical protein
VKKNSSEGKEVAVSLYKKVARTVRKARDEYGELFAAVSATKPRNLKQYKNFYDSLDDLLKFLEKAAKD